MSGPKDFRNLQELCNELQRENVGLRARIEFLEGGVKELRSIVNAVVDRAREGHVSAGGAGEEQQATHERSRVRKTRTNNTDLFTGPKLCAAPKQKKVAAEAKPETVQPHDVEPKRYPLFDDRYSHPIEECPMRAKAVDEIVARVTRRGRKAMKGAL